jgi:hypothetical protein
MKRFLAFLIFFTLVCAKAQDITELDVTNSGYGQIMYDIIRCASDGYYITMNGYGLETRYINVSTGDIGDRIKALWADGITGPGSIVRLGETNYYALISTNTVNYKYYIRTFRCSAVGEMDAAFIASKWIGGSSWHKGIYVGNGYVAVQYYDNVIKLKTIQIDTTNGTFITSGFYADSVLVDNSYYANDLVCARSGYLASITTALAGGGDVNVYPIAVNTTTGALTVNTPQATSKSGYYSTISSVNFAAGRVLFVCGGTGGDNYKVSLHTRTISSGGVISTNDDVSTIGSAVFTRGKAIHVTNTDSIWALGCQESSKLYLSLFYCNSSTGNITYTQPAVDSVYFGDGNTSYNPMLIRGASTSNMWVAGYNEYGYIYLHSYDHLEEPEPAGWAHKIWGISPGKVMGVSNSTIKKIFGL